MAESILIVKLSSLGDVLHTLPAAMAIRRAFPKARLGWAVERAHAEVVRTQPWLDQVIEWDRRRLALVSFFRALRRTEWDLAVDFQGLFRSAVATWSSGARRRVGYRPAREMASWLYTERVALQTMERHAVDRSLDLASAIGARPHDALPLDRPYLRGAPPIVDRRAAPWFPLNPSERDRAQVTAWLARHEFDPYRDCLVVLNPHSRREANRWSAAHYAALARKLLDEPNVRVALTGGAMATPLCDTIASRAGGQVWRADGQLGILGSAELFKHASCFVTGDTGPMHLAAAVGAPIVAVFGASKPLRTGPYTTAAVALSAGLECSPCLARRCPLRFDPARCMEEVSVDRVYGATIEQLARATDALATTRKTA